MDEQFFHDAMKATELNPIVIDENTKFSQPQHSEPSPNCVVRAEGQGTKLEYRHPVDLGETAQRSEQQECERCGVILEYLDSPSYCAKCGAFNKPSEQKEWTPESVKNFFYGGTYHESSVKLADAINAALTAERAEVGRAAVKHYIEVYQERNIAEVREPLVAVINMIREKLLEGCTIKATDINAPVLQQQADGSWIGGLTFTGKKQ